jgi:tetratricopeptide (TPR) repeat protein
VSAAETLQTSPLQHVKSQLLHLLGAKSLAEGDSRRAVMLLERALQFDPSNVDLLKNLGTALMAGGNAASAVTHLRQATLLDPKSYESYGNLGMALRRLGDRDAATESLRHAVTVCPGWRPACLSLAEILLTQGDLDEAELLLRRSLNSPLDDADTLLALGKLHASRHEWTTAAQCFDSVLQSQPGHLGALCALTTVVADERLEELTARLRSAATTAESEELQFGVQRALATLAHLRRDVVSEADHLRRALLYRPDAVDVRVPLAKLLLLTGDFNSGWPAFEWRWRQDATVLPARGLLRRRWQGEPLQNATIVLHAEQGFGSIIQFSRYAPMVARLGGRVMLEVPAELVRLMGHLEGVEEVVARGESLPTVSWQCPLMSLPVAFGTTVNTIPAEVPYLHANPQEARRWSERLPPGLRVGIAWSGAPWHYNDRRRSIPTELLTPLREVGDVSFVSLQLRPLASAGGSGFTYIDISSALTDFADTAAVMANLDLIITVDTAVAHLAGALGLPVWIMLPFAAEYRWLLEREDSPWYPTARLFRQPLPGDWRSVIGRVTQELRLFVAEAIQC